MNINKIKDTLKEVLHELHFIRTNNRSSENLIKVINQLEETYGELKGEIEVTQITAVCWKCQNRISRVKEIRFDKDDKGEYAQLSLECGHNKIVRFDEFGVGLIKAFRKEKKSEVSG